MEHEKSTKAETLEKVKSCTLNVDCLEELRKYPDKHFDLIITDFPYFSGPERRKFYGRKISPIGVQRLYEQMDCWEIPGKEMFDEVFRVSKHQIIWGINYFNVGREIGPGRIIWDKCNGKSSFSDCEIAYCSLIKSVRMFRYMWNGMMQGKSIAEGHIMQGNKKLNEQRIHITQKPVLLYVWTLQTFAKPGWKICDPTMGSQSSRIAAYDLGFDYVGFEKEKSMYQKGEQRFKLYTAQVKLVEG